ncbi:class I SAM-dependent methyltransferase [Gordonia sp. NB41Y]|uniref:class I SAM-dependent methyltransferase n=1 Tax=Gordonia sp. NB41Y TaxID=875808 RepID=UPI0002BD2BF0|nr:class I SAM-dependent methyltransferase [Gordonia sp. NB41Y]EMP15256.1 SAM-dependent methyltransferase [Gordonia sp. NB41Y]WLP90610.1 class I SAM-dependent methyltransferase [Gordonia sp. NB41Y]
MTHAFDKDYWESHWDGAASEAPSNPYVAEAVRGLTPGRALDAGCGAGAEAIWLAARGWQVTGADISGRALAAAAERADAATGIEPITWIETDVSTWQPDDRWDLVMTNYAHPATPQLDFYRHISDWVAPSGVLLIVGHRHVPDAAHHHTHSHSPEDQPPEKATATIAGITGVLAPENWRIDVAEECERTVRDGVPPLHDIVVRATRLV